MKIFRRIRQLLFPSGHHFKVDDFVILNSEAKKHKYSVDHFGSKSYQIKSIEWTNNIDYCDQFIRLYGLTGQFYNTIFTKS